MGTNESKKFILPCPSCGKQLRVPKASKTLKINCPSCHTAFRHKQTMFALSVDVKRSMLMGSLGGLVGFIISEFTDHMIAEQISNNVLKSAAVSFGILGLCIGGFLGAAEGFYKKNKYRLKYGAKMGIILGMIGGMIAGVIAQLIYGYINTFPFFDSIIPQILGRSVGWSVFGLLLGISYGIKQNTLGDLKSGTLSGAIGGCFGGMLFDPIGMLVPFNNGLVSRLIVYLIIGLSLGTAIQFLQERAIKAKRSDMYRPLTNALPDNLRLLE